VTDWDPYLDLDAGVLRNRLGITDPAELSRAEAELKDMFKRLADSGYLRCRELEDFLDGVSELLGDINALHPFREGNGRTQRAFLAQLAADAGYLLRWTAMDPTENVDASRAAHQGDLAGLRRMLARLVHPPPSLPVPRPAPGTD